jgi:hypothetical protein
MRVQPGGERVRAPQPFRRAFAVAVGQRDLRPGQQRPGQRIRLTQGGPRGGGLVPGREQPGGLARLLP